jgi:predicted PhzF superfamily epimerase YddE/YHI9
MRFFLVDAFTPSAFAGNTAAVVLLDAPADPAWMQSVAAEFKHSETAFVVTGGEGPLPLRWFTPAAEVDLCGHATLATAHVLGGNPVFSTRSGELACRAEDGWVSMDFPADMPVASDDDPGINDTVFVGRGVSDILVVLGDAASVRGFKPDLPTLAKLDTRCVIVTAPGDVDGIDFVSRVFGPAVGVDEDPVTGSAHCTLASYWAARLGCNELVGEQASERGGIVRMTMFGDRVRLSGQAVTIASGELHV